MDSVRFLSSGPWNGKTAEYILSGLTRSPYRHDLLTSAETRRVGLQPVFEKNYDIVGYADCRLVIS